MPHPSAPPGSAARAVGLLLLLAAGCGALPTDGGGGRASALKGDVSELEVQALVMQMADDYDAALGETTYLVLQGGDLSSRSRWLALSFLRNGMGAALDIASGPNPDVALLDLLVLGSLQTWAFGAHWVPSGIDPEAGAAAAARLERAEADLWSHASRLLAEEQMATLRGLVGEWIEEHPDQQVVAFVRFDDFTRERQLSTAGSRAEASLLLRDVGRATAAVEDARLFGERALWFASRYPYLLGQQMELTTYRIADQPEFREGYEALRTLGRSGAALAARLKELDDQLAGLLEALRQERRQTIEEISEAFSASISEALDQIFDRIGGERERIVESLGETQGDVRGTLGEARSTAEATGAAALAMTDAAVAFERLALRFEAAGGGAPSELSIDDLRATAVDAEGAATEATRLVERVESLLDSKNVESAVSAADEAVESSADALFLRGAGLIALLGVALALVRLVPQRTR